MSDGVVFLLVAMSWVGGFFIGWAVRNRYDLEGWIVERAVDKAMNAYDSESSSTEGQ